MQKISYSNLIINNKHTSLNHTNQNTLAITENQDGYQLHSKVNVAPNTHEIFYFNKNLVTGLEQLTYIAPRIKSIVTDITYIKNKEEYLEGSIHFTSNNKTKYQIEFHNRYFTIYFINSQNQAQTIYTFTSDEPLNENVLKRIINLLINEILTFNLTTKKPFFPIDDDPLSVINDLQERIKNFITSIIPNVEENTRAYLNKLLNHLTESNRSRTLKAKGE